MGRRWGERCRRVEGLTGAGVMTEVYQGCWIDFRQSSLVTHGFRGRFIGHAAFDGRESTKDSSVGQPLDCFSSGKQAQVIPFTPAFGKVSASPGLHWSQVESIISEAWNAPSCRPGGTRPGTTGDPGQGWTVCSLMRPPFNTIFHSKVRRREKAAKHHSPLFVLPGSGLLWLRPEPHKFHTGVYFSPPALTHCVLQGPPWACRLGTCYTLGSVQTRCDDYTSQAGLEQGKLWGSKYGQIKTPLNNLMQRGLSWLTTEPNSVWKIMAQSSIRGNLIKVSWLSRPNKACQFVTWHPAVMGFFDRFSVLYHPGSGWALVWLTFSFLLLQHHFMPSFAFRSELSFLLKVDSL